MLGTQVLKRDMLPGVAKPIIRRCVAACQRASETRPAGIVFAQQAGMCKALGSLKQISVPPAAPASMLVRPGSPSLRWNAAGLA